MLCIVKNLRGITKACISAGMDDDYIAILGSIDGQLDGGVICRDVDCIGSIDLQINHNGSWRCVFRRADSEDLLVSTVIETCGIYRYRNGIDLISLALAA